MDRVAMLSAEAGSRRKRKAAQQVAQTPVGHADTAQQQRLDAKAAVFGKLQRTDTDTERNLDEQLTDAGTQDSVQTSFTHAHQLAQQQHPQQQQHALPHAAAAQQHQQQRMRGHEDTDGSSGSETEGPIADDKYIKGTRLIIGGWFQACRGCNEPTAHTAVICQRDVPLCPRCQGKYTAMVTGSHPPSGACPDPAAEPLHYWLPRLVAPAPRLSAAQRREFCDALVLRQDDAWLQLIRMS